MDTKQIKIKLALYLPYLQLMTSLNPTKAGIGNIEIKNSLIEAWEFLKHADETDLIKKGPMTLSLLEKVVNYYMDFAKLKVDMNQINHEFNSFFKNSKELYSFGLEYGWLQGVMDCSNFGFPDDLPYHTKIGIGHHAGSANVEEEFLLRDAFYLLALTEQAYNDMHKFHKLHSNIDDEIRIKDIIYKLYSLNQNVALLSRIALQGYYSFLEAFVNSIGYDYLKKIRKY